MGEQFESVLAGAQQGEEWALTRLYEQLQPSVLAYLRPQDRDAEDIAADAWIDVARGLARFTGDDGAFRRFVFTIVRRRLIDARRRRSRDLSKPAPPDVLDAATAANDVDTVGQSEALQAITAMLPPAQAQVVLLRVVAGFSVDEVAEIVGKRPGAVRAIQHRALRQLAKKLPAPRNAERVSDDVRN